LTPNKEKIIEIPETFDENTQEEEPMLNDE
jgi:hypothetical protein